MPMRSILESILSPMDWGSSYNCYRSHGCILGVHACVCTIHANLHYAVPVPAFNTKGIATNFTDVQYNGQFTEFHSNKFNNLLFLFCM